MNWRYFAGAVLVSGWLALTHGAPAAAVLAGAGLAGLWTWLQRNR